MRIISGKSVCGGIRFGRITFYQRECLSQHDLAASCVDEEIARLESACEQVKEQLQDCYIRVLETSEDEAKIFLSHQMFLEDEEYLASIRLMIAQQQMTAKQAVQRKEQELVSFFGAKDNAHFKARIADIKDVSKQLIDALVGNCTEQLSLSEPTIVVADELFPSEIVQLCGKEIGVIVRDVTSYSHVAILAKTMGIPMLNTKEVIPQTTEGMSAILDGDSGTLYVEPSEEIINQMKQKSVREKNRIFKECGIQICANISDPLQVEEVLKSQADGIGLFRSEMIYLKQDTFPTEEKQFEIYKTVLASMKNKRVVIRTLDVGGDKCVAYLQLPKETNPALGLRGIRYSLSRKDVFKTQLRALLRAGIYGKLAIMFPMIVSLEEVHRIKVIIEEVKQELSEQQMDFCANPELGIMIETPAAVMMSKELAKEVDFFSIGTNDLTQYTLAMDRQNPDMEEEYNPHHPAVLRMIQIATENIHEEGKKISICGDLAADESMIETWLDMGIDQLSVPVSCIPLLSEKV